MATFKNIFNKGTVNTDTDEKLIPNGEVIYAKNVLFNSDGDDGIAKNLLGTLDKNMVLPDPLSIKKQVGTAKFGNKIFIAYYGVDTDDDYIVYYDTVANTTTTILKKELGFISDDNYFVTIDIVDDKYLYWTDGIYDPETETITGVNHPRRINYIESALSPTTYYDDIDVNNILPRPDAPEAYVVYVPDASVEEYMSQGSYSFAVRIKNIHDEWSPLSYKSPSININGREGIQGHVKVNYATILPDYDFTMLKEIEVYLFKDSSNQFLLIHTEDIISDTLSSITLKGQEYSKILDAQSSNVTNFTTPRLAGVQEFAGDRLVYGNIELRLPDFADKNKQVPYRIIANTPSDYTDSVNIVTGSCTVAVDPFITPDDSNVIGLNPSTYGGQAGGNLKVDITDILGTTSYYKVTIPITYKDVDEFAVILESRLKEYDSGITVTVAGQNVTVEGITTGEKLDTSISSWEGMQWLDDYHVGVVHYDEYGRNRGVSNKTLVKNSNHTTSNNRIIRNIQPFLTGSIIPPSWAKKYSIVRTKRVEKYEYWEHKASQVIEVGTNNFYYGFTTNRLSIEFLRSVELTQKATAIFTEDTYRYSSDGRVEVIEGEENKSKEFDYYISKKVELINVENGNGISGAVLDQSTALANGGTADYIYISLSAAPTEANYSYKVPQELKANDDIFYESEVWDIIDDTYEGDGRIPSFGDTYFFSTGSFFSTGEYITHHIDPTEFYELNNIYRPFIEIDETNIDGASTFVHSQTYQASSNYNGLGMFSPLFLNFWDMEKKHGDIKQIIYKDTDLIIAQTDKWNKIPLNKNYIQSSGNNILEKTVTYLNTPIPYNGDFGLSDPRSIARWGYSIYGVDKNNGAVLRLAENGLTVINASRDKEFKDLLTSYNGRIIGEYEMKTNSYVFTLIDLARTFTFSEKTRGQSSEFSYVPKDYIALRGSLYSFVDDKLYEHGKGNVNEFYGTYYPSEVTVSINAEPSTIKTFESLSLESNDAWTANLSTPKNSTDILSTSFTEKEDVWFADIPRDKSSGGDGFSGRHLKGAYMVVNLINDNETDRVELFAVNARVTSSSNHSNT